MKRKFNPKAPITKFQQAMFAFDGLSKPEEIQYMQDKGFAFTLDDYVENETAVQNRFFKYLHDNKMDKEFEDDFILPADDKSFTAIKLKKVS